MLEMMDFWQRVFKRKFSIKQYLTGKAVLTGVGCIWLMCIYPAIVRPLVIPEEYEKRRKAIEKGLHLPQPPGGMREWTNPFEEREKKEPLLIQQSKEVKP